MNKMINCDFYILSDEEFNLYKNDISLKDLTFKDGILSKNEKSIILVYSRLEMFDNTEGLDNLIKTKIKNAALELNNI